MLSALIRIASSWLLIGVGAGVLVGEVRGGGLGGFVFLFWGLAVALGGAVAHSVLIAFPAFRRSIALVQVLAITVLAMLLLLLYAATAGGANPGPRGNLHFYVQVMPYVAPSVLVVATLVNALFTPNADA